MQDQLKSTPEHHATQKKIWVMPDVQIIESNEIMGGSNPSVTETLMLSPTYGLNS